MNLNYAPLKEPVTRADIRNYEANTLNKGTRSYSSLVATITVVALLLYVVVLLVVVKDAGEHILVPVLFAAMLSGFVLIDYARKRKIAKIYKFAVANNLRFIANGSAQDYEGAIFGVGHTRQISEAIVLPNGVEIGNYQYTSGSGRDKKTYYWGYMKVKLVRHVPNMLLDSKKNNFLRGLFSNLPKTYSKDQTIKLEGDFNDYFTLYAPKEYGMDAFYLFTPDVMAALIDHGSDFDIEVIDDNLLFYRSKRLNLTSEEEINGVLSVIDKVSSELISQADYYADERVGDRAANVIAEPGRRLKTKLPMIIVILLIAYLVYVIVESAPVVMRLLDI